MASKRKQRDSAAPKVIVMPMDGSEQRPSLDDHNPRTNPAMRDGNSSHGNPNETAVDEISTDNDAGDA
jgi:hypothetical protein